MIDAPVLQNSLVSMEAEQGLLGALMCQNNALEKVADFLQPEHFADPVHGKIYKKIHDFCMAGKVADPVTLKPSFESEGELANVGGAEYLVHLVAGMVTVINAGHYGQLIHDLYQKRKLNDAFREIQEDILLNDIPAMEIIDRAESLLQGIAENRTERGGLDQVQGTFTEALSVIDRAQKGPITGVPTKLAELDRRLGGLQAGELNILAGRPGMGKTAVALTMAVNAAEAGKKVAFFFLAMSKAALGQRLIARYSGVSTQDQRSRLNTDQYEAIHKSAVQASRLPLFIDDATNMTVGQIRSRARRMKRRHGLDLLVVDYIGLMSPQDKKANKVHQIEEITTGLKKLAKELDIPVLALSQLSRSLESREDKRPMLSDLRDSGSIEQDADVVMFCYRDEYYLQMSEPKPESFGDSDRYSKAIFAWEERLKSSANVIEIITAKYRQGVTGTDVFHFDGHRQVVTNYAHGRD